MPYFIGFYLVALFCLMIPQRWFAIAMAGICAFIFAALRFNAGNDYFSYVRDIETDNIARYEPLSWLLMRLAQETSPQVFFAVTSAVIVGFATATILTVEKRVEVSRFAILAFLSLPAAYLESLGYVRQFCAATILIYAFVRRDNLPLAGVLVALVAGFHTASIAYVPVLAAVGFWRVRIPTIVYLAVLTLSFFGSDFIRFVSELTGFYSHYFVRNTTSFGRSAMLLYAAIFLVILGLRRWVIDGRLDKEFNLFFVGVCLYAALVPYGGSLARGAWFAIGIAPVLIGAVVARTGEAGRIVSVVIFTALFGYQIYLANSNATRDFLGGYVPYFLTTPDERDEAMSDWEKAVH